jgi:hypothetical protein
MVSAAVALLLPALAGSQDPPALPKTEGDSIPTLELRADPTIERGKVAAVQGTVGPDGLRFMVGELSILQPVTVILLARDDADDLTLTLFKKDWTTVRRNGSTRGSGITTFEFRTQGGVNILLRGAATATPFALVVWAGEELRPSMPDVVVSYDEFRKRNPNASVSLSGSRSASGGRGTSLAAWIALTVVGAGAVGLFARRGFSRRKEA